MGIREALRRYFTVESRGALTPEEMTEARILGDILRGSGAPELLIEERNTSWGGLGEIRAEELIKDEGHHSYRLETALAYPRQAKTAVIVAVGAYRRDTGFGIYVSSDGERLFSGRTDDERLHIELLRAFGQITLQMTRRGML